MEHLLYIIEYNFLLTPFLINILPMLSLYFSNDINNLIHIIISYLSISIIYITKYIIKPESKLPYHPFYSENDQKYKGYKSELVGIIMSITFMLLFYQIYHQCCYNYLSKCINNQLINQEILPIYKPLSNYVAKILINNAIEEKNICPITHEQINVKNSGVLACGHVFTGSVLRKYTQKNNNICPICKIKSIPTFFIEQ